MPPKESPVDKDAIMDAIRRLEARMEGLEERLDRLEGRVDAVKGANLDEPCCSEDVIGCLDDCVIDVKSLRKKVEDARSTRGH